MDIFEVLETMNGDLTKKKILRAYQENGNSMPLWLLNRIRAVLRDYVVVAGHLTKLLGR